MILNKIDIVEVFESLHEKGECSQLSIINGDEVLEINTPNFESDSLVNVYSLSKMMVNLCLYKLLADYQISIFTPLNQLWPSFAKKGKDNICLNHILSHNSGIPHFSNKIVTKDLYKWESIIEVIENTTPLHLPSENVAYHARNYGYIIGEIIKIVSGVDFSTYFRNEIAVKLGLEFHFGVSEEKVLSRVIPLYRSNNEISSSGLSQLDSISESVGELIDKRNMVYSEQVFMNPYNDILSPNDGQWLKSCIPSSGGVSNAFNINKIMFWAIKYFNEVFSKVKVRQPLTMDLALGFNNRWSLGFVQNSGEFGISANRIGMRAIGGGIYFYDYDSDFHFCYTPARMIPQVGRFPAHDPRVKPLLDLL